MEITKAQQDNIGSIARRHNVRLLTLFGSRVSGKTHEGSDLDIGVLFHEKPVSYYPLFDVQSDLEKVFPGHTLDVRYLHKAAPYFFFNAVYKGERLYGDTSDYARLCGKAFKNFADTKKLRDTRDEIIERRQKQFLNKVYD